MNWLSNRPDWQLLTGLIIALIAFKAWLIQAAGFDLHFDEAQYWEWSQQPDWSYYSKGPLVAWLIAIGDGLFGHGEWQVRLFAWLIHGVFLVLVFKLAYEIWQKRSAAWWAVLLVLTTPLYFTLGLVMTTDVLLFVFWTWGSWAAYRVYFKDQHYAWYELGAAVGIGALGKLSIGLLPFFIGMMTLIKPRYRHHLANPHLWYALILMLVFMSPLLIWNATHDWVMFRHELGHLKHEDWSLKWIPRFIIGQWLIVSPLIVVIMIMVLRHIPKFPRQRFLWLISVGCFILFVIKAGGANIQANWVAPTYIGMMVLFAGHVTTLSRRRKWLVKAGMVISIMLLAFIYFPTSFGLSSIHDPFKVTKQWREPVRDIAAQVSDVDFILAPNYRLAAEFAFYWPDRKPVYVVGQRRRFNQHDLWPSVDREAGNNGLYVSTNSSTPAQLTQAFSKCQQIDSYKVRGVDNAIIRTLYVRYCENYHVVTWPIPSSY